MKYACFILVLATIQLLTFTTIDADSTGCSSECAGAPKDKTICASNGIAYESTCRYECAKKKVTRLRIVQEGNCKGLGLNDFRQGQKRYEGK